MFIHVFNEAGNLAFRQEGADRAIVDSAVAHGAVLVTHADKAFDAQPSIKPHVRHPAGYDKAKKVRRTAPAPRLPSTYRPGVFPVHDRLCEHTGLQVYTDGSKIDEDVGQGTSWQTRATAS